MNKLTIRASTTDDADVLRRVFENASHGISPYLWRKAVEPNQDFDEFVHGRMCSKIVDPDQTFNVAEIDGLSAGGILTYQISAIEQTNGHSPMMRSFVDVDNALLGSVYVNAIAVFAEFRRLGIASALLQRAKETAAQAGLPLSLSVCDANVGAISTYEKNGFRHEGRVKMENEDWDGDGEYWLLMVNETAHAWDRRHTAVKHAHADKQVA